ncbi:hypothetical protein B296_00021716 [Ensete ventricosum]|uniref:Uncharacterized protein n=1 Tax=Ensete ventricosum TaxID=4639 RepID=A0A426Z478_ENSVE|nr:hypothetical protein B296_00021716 [Ensete ventricosum]
MMLPPRFPNNGIRASKRSKEMGQPAMARPSAAKVPYKGAVGYSAVYGHKLSSTRVAARRSDAHGGAAYGCNTDRKGNSARPLGGRLPAGKGSRRLRRGGGSDTVRMREEG